VEEDDPFRFGGEVRRSDCKGVGFRRAVSRTSEYLAGLRGEPQGAESGHGIPQKVASRDVAEMVLLELL